MPRFFCETFEELPQIVGDDASHIALSLRMKKGETLTVCDTKGTDYNCEISEISAECVKLNILSKKKSDSEPSVKVTLYQCMPKSDKLETVVQKAVELGVCEVVPVLSSRCISRPDSKSALKKVNRLQKIADEAAKQSGRSVLPKVREMISFHDCCGELENFDKAMIFYELGGDSLREIIDDKPLSSAAIIIGPEGGFSAEEVEKAIKSGAVAASLGKRILRTETAPLAALTAIMLLSGNLE